jgi:hypothetical protein
MDFVKTVLDAMDVSFVTAAASFASDVSRLMGTQLRPLNYYAKAWKDPGEPFTIDISLSFRFGQDKKYDAKTETVDPVLNIIGLTYPTALHGSSGGGAQVQGPGPTPSDIFLEMSGALGPIQDLLPKPKEKKRSYAARFEWLESGSSKELNTLRNEALKGSSQKEVREAWNAYITGGINGVEKWEAQSNINLQDTLDKLREGEEDITGLRNTWEVSLGGYIFKHLVCIASSFTFHPEVDSKGYPIHSELFLSFQPYLIALSNKISKDYGWHK